MDNEYRKKWDKILIQHEQLQVDENSGTEIGQSIKKFPLMTPREYILAWRVWEGKNKTFYCIIKVSKMSISQPPSLHCITQLMIYVLYYLILHASWLPCLSILDISMEFIQHDVSFFYGAVHAWCFDMTI